MLKNIQTWLRRYTAATMAFVVVRLFDFLLPFILELILFIALLPVAELYLDGTIRRLTGWGERRNEALPQSADSEPRPKRRKKIRAGRDTKA